MKELVYRVLAGFFGLGFGIFLSIGNTSYLSNKMYISSWAIAIGFGLFAILGTHIAESFLAKFFGMEGTNKNPPPSEPSDASKALGPRKDERI